MSTININQLSNSFPAKVREDWEIAFKLLSPSKDELQKGHSPRTIRKVIGGNVLRVLDSVWGQGNPVERGDSIKEIF